MRAAFVLCFLLVLPNAARAFGTVETVVGSVGEGAASEVGISPRSLVHWRGRVFFYDGHWNVLRELDLRSREIRNVVGDGEPGFEGDGGPAVDARIEASRLAIDPDGNLFLADRKRIRRIDRGTGVIETLAEVPAAELAWGDDSWLYAAEFAQPGTIFRVDPKNGEAVSIGSASLVSGIALDAKGLLLASQFQAQDVLSLEPGTGVATKFFPAARCVGEPVGGVVGIPGRAIPLAPDVALLSFFTGARASIYEVDRSGGGCRMRDLASPSGAQAVAAFSDELLLVSRSADRRGTIVAIDRSSGVVEILAGAPESTFSGDGRAPTHAQLSAPSAVAAEPVGGGLFIADTRNHRVRYADVGGTSPRIRTVAGTGERAGALVEGTATRVPIRFPEDLAVAPDGTVYIVTQGALQRLRNFYLDTVAGGPGARSGIGIVTGVGVAPDGTPYVAGRGGPALGANSHVWRLRLEEALDAKRVLGAVASGTPLPEEGHYDEVGFPMRDVAVDAEGNVYVSSPERRTIFRLGLDHRVRAYVRSESAVARLEVGDDSTLFFSASDGIIRRVRSRGRHVLVEPIGRGGGFSGDGGPAAQAEFRAAGSQPAIGPDGDLFIADVDNHRIRRVSAPFCSNGVRDRGEACDGGACCTDACQIAGRGSACRSAGLCLSPGTCDGVIPDCSGRFCLSLEPVVSRLCAVLPGCD